MLKGKRGDNNNNDDKHTTNTVFRDDDSLSKTFSQFLAAAIILKVWQFAAPWFPSQKQIQTFKVCYASSWYPYFYMGCRSLLLYFSYRFWWLIWLVYVLDLSRKYILRLLVYKYQKVSSKCPFILLCQIFFSRSTKKIWTTQFVCY